MVDVDRLFKCGYVEFDHVLKGKEYNIRMYVYDELKNFYPSVFRFDDIPAVFPLFLENLIIVKEFEIYHCLIIDDRRGSGQYMRLYNMQVEIAEKEYRNPVRMVPEFTLLNFDQHKKLSEKRNI